MGWANACVRYRSGKMWHWDFLTSSFGVNPITKGEAEAWGCGINGWRVSTGLNTELKSISARTNTTATTACSTGPAHHQYINTLIWCLHNTSAFKFDWTTKIIVYESGGSLSRGRATRKFNWDVCTSWLLSTYTVTPLLKYFPFTAQILHIQSSGYCVLPWEIMLFWHFSLTKRCESEC